MTTHTPYGYKIIKGQAIIDESVACKIRLLFNEFLHCGSMRAAAIKAGIEKNHSVVGRILKNKLYLGDDYYPQLIDADVFNRVQDLRNNNAKAQNRIREYKEQTPCSDVTKYKIKKLVRQFDNPFKQAEYAYSLIEEEKHE